MGREIHPARVTRNWEYQRVYRKGRKYWNRHLVIYVARGTLNRTRLGITVTKKIGKSVQRNRLKRLIRESFRLLRSRVSRGCDVVVVGRSAAVGVKCQQVHAALLQLLKKADAIDTEARNAVRNT